MLDHNAKTLRDLHLRLSTILSPIDWEHVDRATAALGDSLHNRDTERLKQKFERLPRKNKPNTKPDRHRLVINLTDERIDEDTLSVLSKGLNFAPAPRSIPFSDIIGGVEQAVRKLPNDAAEDIRAEISMTLKKAVPPKSNISFKERAALRSLRKNTAVTILPADKGNATVLMKTLDYQEKMKELLTNNSYKRIPRDPTDSISRKTIKLIKEAGIPLETARHLRAEAPVPPRIYGLPKIHKEGVPLRPIVSAISSPTYNLAKYLTGILAPHVGVSEHHVKKSLEFVETIKEIRVDTTDILVSLDVVSLFTCVPLADTMRLLAERFDSDTVKLFHHVLTSTYFSFDGQFYEQTEGVAMGSPLSPAIANFYMENFEKQALNSAPLKPKCFFRYVDDTFLIWPHGKDLALDLFFAHMNSQHPSIKFTMEKETNGQLPFLDILIQKKKDGSLGHSIYRKATHTDLYLNNQSHHHPSQKQAVLSTLLHRAKKIPDNESIQNEIKHLKITFRKNGYSKHQISEALKRTFNKPIGGIREPKQRGGGGGGGSGGGGGTGGEGGVRWDERALERRRYGDRVCSGEIPSSGIHASSSSLTTARGSCSLSARSSYFLSAASTPPSLSSQMGVSCSRCSPLSAGDLYDERSSPSDKERDLLESSPRPQLR
ncbi:uncharacterized protein LOC124164403 [Ischnura elegans]|uniref:uncharacterized protein LOC124164403 n=1 Tax=Ischnura elegans TaxID=197161 RepID=UPI001ED8A876|nr:uncharacterized protein LOC124164403 [Ischnura elegans]